MRATPMSRPTPFSSRKRTTPSTAASPKALPPVRSRAWVGRMAPIGPRRSVSRVPGEEPRTSTPTTAPSWPSKRTAVQPVTPSLSVAWPTSTPGTSQRLSSTPALRVRTWGGFRDLPLVCVGGYDTGVVPGQGAEGDLFLIRAPRAELDEDGVFDHGVVNDLTFPVTELDGRVAEGRALLELLVGVVLVAHAALHLSAATQDLLVRRHALLLGQPDVDRTHTPGTAPRRAAQGQAARVASACVPRPVYKTVLSEGDLRVVGPFEAALDGPQIHFLVIGLVFDLDVGAVQGDVATDKLHAFEGVVPGELPGLFPDAASQFPVAILRPGVLLRDDPDYVVGLCVRLAASRRQGDATDQLPHLGRDDYRVADPDVKVPRVAEPGDAPARDPDIHEPREGSSIFRRMRDNVTSRIASGETLYASAARPSPRARAVPAQSAPGYSSTDPLISPTLSVLAASSSAPDSITAASLYRRANNSRASLTAPSLAAFPARLAPSFARLSGSSNSAINSRSRASPTASARPTIFLTASCRPSKSSERANPALKTASRSFANSGSSAYRSESPTLPLPSWAASSGSAAPLPCRNPATTLVGTGLNRRIWARERIVGSTPSREVASSRKTVSPTGSSSVLSSAFAACTFSVSALRMNARRAPSKGRLAARRTISLACPIVVNVPWGTISVRSGCTPLSALSSAATSPEATSAAPNLSATIRLPTPGGPWNRYACETSPVSRARPSSRSAVSFPSTPSNVSRRSAISLPSILQLAHPTHHQSGKVLRRERGIEDFDPLGLQMRQLLETLLHTSHEAGAHRLDPVWRHPEFPGPPFPLVLAQPQIECPLRHEGPDGVGVHGADRFDAEPSTEALVGKARVQVPLAEHVLASFETREYRGAHVVSAGRSVQVRFRPGFHLCLRVEDDLPDDLGHRGTAGLAGEVCRRSRTCKQYSDGAYQGGLAREVRSLEGYEDAPPCTLRGRPSS